MAEFTNEYCMHTATCGELRKEDCGREVTLTGGLGTTATMAG